MMNKSRISILLNSPLSCLCFRFQILLLVILFAIGNTNRSFGQKNVKEPPLIIQSLDDSLDLYRYTDTLKYLSLLDELKHTSDLRDDNQLLSYYHYYCGFYNNDRGRFNEAEVNFDNALSISNSLEFKDYRLLFQVHYQFAFAKSRLDKVEGSRKSYWLCYDHAQYLNDSISLALASYGISSMLIEMNNYREAKTFASQTLAIDLALNDSISISYDYGLLANIYFKLKMYSEAFLNFKNSRSYVIKEKSLHQYCSITNAMSEVSIYLNNYTAAIAYAKEAMDISKNANLTQHYVRAKIHYANADYRSGKVEKAINEFNAILKIAEQKKLIREQIRVNFLLGKLSVDKDLAFFYLKKALKLTKDSGTNTYLESIYKALNKIELTHNIALKEKLKDEYILFLESGLSENRKSLIESMDNSGEIYSLNEKNTKLNLAVAQQKLELLKQKNQQRILFGLTIVFGLIFICIYLFQKQKNKIKSLELSKNIFDLEAQLSKVLQNRVEIKLPSLNILNSKIVGHLTSKEYEITKDILDRKTNKEIAIKHSISINTVKFHLKNIHIKLNTANKKAVIKKIMDVV